MASILTPAARGPNSPENTIRGKHPKSLSPVLRFGYNPPGSRTQPSAAAAGGPRCSPVMAGGVFPWRNGTGAQQQPAPLTSPLPRPDFL